MGMVAAYRAVRGTAGDTRGLYQKVSEELFDAYTAAAAERGITKRALLERALMREINEPTLLAPLPLQEELPLRSA